MGRKPPGPAGARQTGQGLACKRNKSASLPDLIMTIIRNSREILTGGGEGAYAVVGAGKGRALG